MSDFPEVGLRAVLEGAKQFEKDAEDIERSYVDLAAAEDKLAKASERMGKLFEDLGASMKVGSEGAEQAAASMSTVGAAIDEGVGTVEASLTEAKSQISGFGEVLSTELAQASREYLDEAYGLLAQKSPELVQYLRAQEDAWVESGGAIEDWADIVENQYGDAVEEIAQGAGEAGTALESMAGILSLGVVQQVAGSMERLGDQILAFAKDATMTTARVEELGFVLDNLAKQNDVSADALRDQVQAVRDQGIQADVAYRLVTQFVQANLDLEKASELARVAQDAAVISMEDSSQALAGILNGVITLQPEMLRYRGLIVDLEGEYRKWAEESGKAYSEITGQEKQQIALNAAIAAGAEITGTYESAMESASKQLRSFPRYINDLKIEMGESLLPVYSNMIFATKDLIKWLGELPPEMKAAGAAVGTVAGGMLKATGSAVQMGSQLGMLAIGLKELGIAAKLSSVAFLGPLGLAAGLATVVAVGAYSYIKAQEQAHLDEAVAVARGAESYDDYVSKIEEAGLKGYELSESLYEIAKGADAAKEGLDALALTEAFRNLDEAIGGATTPFEWLNEQMAKLNEQGGLAVEVLEAQMANLLPTLSDVELVVLQDEDAVRRLGEAAGYSGSNLDAYAAIVLKAADAEDKLRQFIGWAEDGVDAYTERIIESREEHEQATIATDGLRASTDRERAAVADLAEELGWGVDEVRKYRYQLGYTDEEIKAVAEDMDLAATEVEDLAESTGLSAEAIHYMNGKLKMGEQAIRDWAQSAREARQAALDFAGTLAGGLLNLRDLQQNAADSKESYDDAYNDIINGSKKARNEINKNFKASLPDRTTVAERMQMAGDAWDEWGLRIKDIMKLGVESPWLETLNKLGYEKPPDVGMQTWLKDLEKKFYEGRLPDLLPPEWADKVRQQQEAATAAVDKETAARLKKLREERAEQLRLEQEARNDAMLELSLTLAEQKGLLDQWAGEAFGPDWAAMGVDANLVFDLIKSGMLDVSGGLEGLITDMSSTVQQTLDVTGGAAQTNKEIVEGAIAAGAEAAAAAQAQQEEAAAAAARAAEEAAATAKIALDDAFDPETQAAAKGIADEAAKIGPAVSDNMPTGVFVDLLAEATEFTGELTTGAENLGVSFQTTFNEVTTSGGTTAEAVRAAFADTAFPAIQTAGITAATNVQNAFAGMASAAQTAANDVISALGGIEGAARSARDAVSGIASAIYRWKTAVDELIGSYQRLYTWMQNVGGIEESPPMAMTAALAIASAYSRWTSEVADLSREIGRRLARALQRASEDVDELRKGVNALMNLGTSFGDFFDDRVLEGMREEAEALGDQADEMKKVFDEWDELFSETSLSQPPFMPWLASSLEDYEEGLDQIKRELDELNQLSGEQLSDFELAIRGIDDVIEAYEDEISNIDRWLEGELEDMGLAAEDTLTPFEKLQRHVKDLDDQLQGIDDELSFYESLAPTEEALAEIARLEQEREQVEEERRGAVLDAMALRQQLEAELADWRMAREELIAEQRRTLLERQAMIEAEIAAKREEAMEAWLASLAEAAEAEKALAELERERYAMEKARQDLAFLEEQFKLLDLISEFDLDADRILGDLQLGLDADPAALLAAMQAAVEAIVLQLQQELSDQPWPPPTMPILLPDQQHGGQYRVTGAGGIDNVPVAFNATAGEVITVTPVGHRPPAISGLGPQQPAVNVYFGETVINNGLDQAMFEARVERAVIRATRGT